MEDKGYIQREKGGHRNIKIVKEKESIYVSDKKKEDLIREFEDKFLGSDATKKEEEMLDWVNDTLNKIWS
jgi:hypothetical protein